jgi:hypothetical protein
MSKLDFNQDNWYSEPKITGKYKGIDYTLCTVSRGKRRRMPVYTEIKMILPPCKNIYHLRIYVKGSFIEVNTVADLKKLETGDPLFDRIFTVKSKTPDKIHHILNPHMRSEMLKYKPFINISLDENELSYRQEGIIRNSHKLICVSEIMYLIACQITGNKAEIENNKSC